MKLLMILPSTARGGTEEHALTIASAAVNKGWDVYAAFPQTEGTTSLIRDFKARHIHYWPLNISAITAQGLKRRVGSFLRFTRTLRVLIKVKPTAVLINLPSHHLCLASLMVCGLVNIPTVVIFHLIPGQIYLSKLKLKTYSWLRNRCQKWVTVSKHNQSLISDKFQMPFRDILCIKNGIELSATLTVKTDRSYGFHDQLCQELGISKTSKVLLTVARLHSQKGHCYLLPIIPILIQEFPDVTFVWVGDGGPARLANATGARTGCYGSCSVFGPPY